MPGDRHLLPASLVFATAPRYLISGGAAINRAPGSPHLKKETGLCPVEYAPPPHPAHVDRSSACAAAPQTFCRALQGRAPRRALTPLNPSVSKALEKYFRERKEQCGHPRPARHDASGRSCVDPVACVVGRREGGGALRAAGWLQRNSAVVRLRSCHPERPLGMTSMTSRERDANDSSPSPGMTTVSNWVRFELPFRRSGRDRTMSFESDPNYRSQRTVGSLRAACPGWAVLSVRSAQSVESPFHHVRCGSYPSGLKN